MSTSLSSLFGADSVPAGFTEACCVPKASFAFQKLNQDVDGGASDFGSIEEGSADSGCAGGVLGRSTVVLAVSDSILLEDWIGFAGCVSFKGVFDHQPSQADEVTGLCGVVGFLSASIAGDGSSEGFGSMSVSDGLFSCS